MKLQILSVAGVLCLSAYASAFTVSVPPQKSTSGTQPMRYAKLKVLVTKMSAVQQADGKYVQQTDPVCTKEGQAAVFPENAVDPVLDPKLFLTCETTLKVGKVTVSMLGLVGFMKNEDVLGDGVRADYKSFMETFWIQSQSGAYAKSIPFHYVSTENLNEKTMVIRSDGQNLTENKPGEKVIDESIFVTYKFED